MAEDKELPFSIDRYNKLRQGSTYLDAQGTLANKLSHTISFRNVRADKTKPEENPEVFFKAFIVDFNETYTPNFNSNEVFGRTDPIYGYKGTTRNISLSFKVPAATESEAYENLGRVQKLIQMLYPGYATANALTLSEAPLVRLKVMNILRSQESLSPGPIDMGDDDAKLPSVPKGDEKYFAEYRSTANSDNGLLGVISSCTVNSMLNSNDGVFNKLTTVPPSREGEKETTRAEPNTVLPKLIEISINFQPIHEKTLGTGAGNNAFTLFPYGVQLADSKPVKLPPAAAKLVQLQRNAEAKRQAASSAQQERDNAQAQYDRVKRALDRSVRRGELTEAEAERRRKIQETGIMGSSEDDLKKAQSGYKASQAELNEYSEFL
jgi:hypothetical protein